MEKVRKKKPVENEKCLHLQTYLLLLFANAASAIIAKIIEAFWYSRRHFIRILLETSALYKLFTYLLTYFCVELIMTTIS